MRIGLLGGTFDPPHNAHLALAEAALASGAIDRLIVMPAGTPPHKQGRTITMAGFRYEMACRTFAGDSRIEVSDLEILRQGLSYTLLTIEQLQAVLPPQDQLILVFGSDILNDLENWHEPARIMAACPLLLALRGGCDAGDAQAKAEDLKRRYGARINFFAAPLIELSSSRLRSDLARGADCHAALPERVIRLIRRHGLYQAETSLSQIEPALMARLAGLEREIWSILDRKRLLHSLNVMTYSLHLAAVHGVSLEQAGIAALLHDCAKCLPRSEAHEYAVRFGDLSLLEPELAHGPAGAWLARERFGIDDPDIIHAIQYHTTGCAGMNALDKIIFIADKVEPARTYENLDEIRRLVEHDLDAALTICLSEIDLYLKREKLSPHPYTGQARDELDRKRQSLPSKADLRYNKDEN